MEFYEAFVKVASLSSIFHGFGEARSFERLADRIRSIIQSATIFLCQPALCSHAVLTFPTSFSSLDTGCEAFRLEDSSVGKEMLQNLAF